MWHTANLQNCTNYLYRLQLHIQYNDTNLHVLTFQNRDMCYSTRKVWSFSNLGDGMR